MLVSTHFKRFKSKIIDAKRISGRAPTDLGGDLITRKKYVLPEGMHVLYHMVH